MNRIKQGIRLDFGVVPGGSGQRFSWLFSAGSSYFNDKAEGFM
jgi:hypothetical protein